MLKREAISILIQDTHSRRSGTVIMYQILILGRFGGGNPTILRTPPIVPSTGSKFKRKIKENVYVTLFHENALKEFYSSFSVQEKKRSKAKTFLLQGK